MRLLLDEMYSPALAEHLRRRGHDALAVADTPGLRSMPDADLFAAAQDAGRAVVTENVPDYVALVRASGSRHDAHYGVVLVSSSRYPRRAARTLGRMVIALDELLATHLADEATSLVHWL